MSSSDNLPVDSLPASAVLPEWVQHEILVFDSHPHWTGAIRAELIAPSTVEPQSEYSAPAADNHTSPTLTITAVSSEPAVIQHLRSHHVRGLVIVLNERERAALKLLWRLFRQDTLVKHILVIGDTRHRELLPLLFETGVSSVVLNQPTDIQVAAWCRKIAGIQ